MTNLPNVPVVGGQLSVASKYSRQLTTGHWPLTTDNYLPSLFLASLSCSGLKRTSLVALSKLTTRAALKRTLIRAQTCTPIDRQNALNFGVWARNNVNADQLTDSSRGRSSSVSSRLYRTHITADKDRHVAGADVLFSQELNIRSFDHCISGFNSPDETFGLDHSECF
jgi:hypothetical protein